MQATSSYPSSSRSGFGLFLILIVAGIVLAAAYPLVVDFSASHGAAKHGTATAEAIRKCIADNGPLQTWVNPDTGRRAHICQLPNGVFGIQIIEQIDGIWKEKTVFLKSKLSILGQVMRYLTNVGYHVVH